MIVRLRTEPKGRLREIDVKSNTTAEEIYKRYKNQLPYSVFACKVDNKYEDLTYRITRPCLLELLDIRTQAANLIYQYSLSLIYVKAVEDVLGDYRLEIQNSINKGLYTEIKGKKPVTASQVHQVEMRMREIVRENMPFVKEIVSREEGLKIMEDDGRKENQRILHESLNIKRIKFYSLDGCRDFFYGLMVPSTGYVKYFELVKYRRGVLLRFPHPTNPDKIPPFNDERKLYAAFGEQTKWSKLLGINYVMDLNEKIENGKYKELIQVSEALHEKKTAEIADLIKKNHKRIILIAGPSSSGKTTFARRLCVQLRVNGMDPLYMGTDDYFVERENTPLDEKGEKDYENLNSLDVELFNSNMNDLLMGKTVDLPTFDFMTGHKIFGKRITSVSPNQPIIVEGIHALNETLTEKIQGDKKFKIYICPLTQLNIDEHNRVPTTDERMLRRIVRDNLYRGHDAQSTIAGWPSVRAGEDRNIFPYSGEADVLFNSYHAYEISVLKKYAEPLLECISPDEAEYAEAVRMLKFLRFFRTIEDDSVIVNNSILREFIGGSIFVE